jgi:hypothetical protein
MHSAAHYRDRAAGYRRMAKDADPSIAELMEVLARDYDRLADRLEPQAEPPNSPAA